MSLCSSLILLCFGYGYSVLAISLVYSSKLSDSKFWVKSTSRGKLYLKEVHANGNLKVPRKFIKAELGADSVLPN